MSEVNQIEIGDVLYDVNDKRFSPDAATEEMTQSVGVDENGKLKTAPSDGVNSDFIAELQTILNAVSFYDNNMTAHITHLSEYAGGGGGGTRFTITKNLTGVTISNTANDIAEGLTFTATLTAEAEGYEPSNVSITMGGVDITSTVYNDKTINIVNVSGNIVITATAVRGGAIYVLSAPIVNENDTSDGNVPVDTGFKLFERDEDKTLLAEIEFFDTLTGGNNYNRNQFFSNAGDMSENARNTFFGRYNGSGGNLEFQQRNPNGINTTASFEGNFVGKTVRIAIVYKASERKAYYYLATTDAISSIAEKTLDLSGWEFVADTHNFIIGGAIKGQNYGTIRSTSINECEIYNAAFSRDAVVDWFGH